MAGASEQTLRVTEINANYEAGPSGSRGKFSFLLVTEDGERHVLEPDAHDVAPLVAIIEAAGPILWDPRGRTLIPCNLVGEWLPEDWSGLAL